MPATLIIKDGGSIHGIWDEVIDLTRLGKLTIERLTEIKWDEGLQRWVVMNMSDDSTLFTDPSRDECLAWEAENAVMLIERKMAEQEKKEVWACKNGDCSNMDTYPRNHFESIGADERCVDCGWALGLKEIV